MEAGRGAPSRVLVLGAGAAQLGLLRAARSGGLYVVAADRDSSAPGLRLADRATVVSAEDEEAVERLAREERVDGLVSPGADWPVRVAARVAARLGLPHPLSPEVAERATSKTLQRRCFEEAGVAQPGWRLLHPGFQVGDCSLESGSGLALPLVVKAPDRQGQRGLSLVRKERELAPAVERALAASRSGFALLEELVEGPEVTVNAWVEGGRFVPLTVTDRITADPPAFGVALAHVWPSEAADEEAVEVARAAAAALGVRDGPTYTQLRVGPDGPKVIELAARLGGGHDAELCLAALGVDLNRLALVTALGETIPAPAPRPSAGGACVRFLVAPPGELARVEGLAEARRLPGVLAAEVYRQPPWRFGPLRTGRDRAGFVLTTGDSRSQALARADAAAERIRFRTVDAQALV